MMSTFNGEKYIVEQVDSILCQSNVNLKLLVRDDGSTDNTTDIILEYVNKYPDSIVLIKGYNIGWRKSFFKLIEYASKNYGDCKYYAFADQDDIWLPDKLSKAIEHIKPYDSEIALYCSNFYLYENGINKGLGRDNSLSPSPKKCLIRNLGLGCSEVMNKNLLISIADNIPNIEIAHDEWVYVVANLCGRVFVDNESYILYRQHNNNQVGFKREPLNIWKRRLKTLAKSLHTHPKETMAKELLLKHRHQFKPGAYEIISKIANYRVSFLSKFNLLIDNEYTFNKFDSDIFLKLKIIFGIL